MKFNPFMQTDLYDKNNQDDYFYEESIDSFLDKVNTNI